MADTTTTNLGLTKPEVGASADTWGGKFNTNLDLVDGLFAAAGSGTSVGLNVGAGKTLTVGGTQNMSALTASTALALDASKNVVSVTNTGTGSNVLSASPTLTGTISAAAQTFSGVATFSAGSAAAPSITTTGDTNTGIFFPAADTIGFSEGGAEAMRIDSSGQVGIGMTPARKLYVTGTFGATGAATFGSTIASGAITSTGRISQALAPVSGEFALRSTGQTTGYIAVTMENTGGSYIVAGENSTGNNLIIGDSAYDMVIRGPSGISFSANAGATQQMRLDSSGNVGIGTSSPGEKLTVAGGSLQVNTTGTIANFTSGGLASSATVQIQAANGAGYDARLYFECPGSNSGGFTFERSNSRLNAYSQTEFSGPYVTAAGTSWTTASDQRLKKNIQSIEYGLNAVMALLPKRYVYKNNEEKQCFGLIAQDVFSVIPEIVDIPKDADEMMGIEYQSVIPVLVKAIQEQQAMINELMAKVATLETK